jgi:hypothetical protein
MHELMRAIALISLLWAGAGCGPSAAYNLLCTYCTDDSQCGGNPCFQDVTGARFCGAPCDNSNCPAGYACLPVTGTAGTVSSTCFPTNEQCLATVVPDGGVVIPPGVDLAGFTPPGNDAAMPPKPDMAIACTPPAGGTIGPNGGTVDRLFFGYTGDTRPPSGAGSFSSYPSQLQMVINNIFTQMGKQGVAFALDGGDHMEASNLSDARGCMADYASAAALLGKPVFMTMGNHACAATFNNDCGFAGAATSDPKMQAFMESLQTVSGQTSPYYRFDVMTQSGLAVFIVVADDAWNSTQQTWLTQQLNDADAHAKYTFVSKHHPDGNTDQPTFQQIYDLVKMHKYTLFLTGHSHEYKRQYTDPRAVVMGLGGAPFDNPNQMWWGYLTAMQCPDDRIYVNVYDQATGNVQANFNVLPQ